MARPQRPRITPIAGPILGGALAEATSYTVMFLVAIIIKGAAVWVIMGNIRRRKLPVA